jgi:hypothetical protein
LISFYILEPTSGTAPSFLAITGVPQAIDSISTIPNGSAQPMGKRKADALPNNTLKIGREIHIN